MTKGYWISCYRSISKPEALVEYGKLAGPAIRAGGGRILARGIPAGAFEAGQKERTVLIEFDSVEQAIATHESEAYLKAVEALGDGAVRDIRIIEGLD